MNSELFIGIDHPAIAADDVVALTKWYCDVLGYKVFAQTDKPVFIIEAPDGTYIEVMPKDEMPRPNRTNNTPGWSHLALRVSDFDSAVAVLDKQGVKWEGPEIQAAGGGRLRSFFDPEGNMLQIVQR